MPVFDIDKTKEELLKDNAAIDEMKELYKKAVEVSNANSRLDTREEAEAYVAFRDYVEASYSGFGRKAMTAALKMLKNLNIRFGIADRTAVKGLSEKFYRRSYECKWDIVSSNDLESEDYYEYTKEEFADYCSKLLSIGGFSDIAVSGAGEGSGTVLTAENKGVKYCILCVLRFDDLEKAVIDDASMAAAGCGCGKSAVMTNVRADAEAAEYAKDCGVLIFDIKAMNEMVDGIFRL